jgi:multidrug efflux pump subunit AcrB
VSGLNLSDWALKHRSFIVFIMAAVTLASIASFFSLGRAEDPPFTFRTMIVQAGWPGATMDDTLQQVTERLECKLQETRGLDFLRSYTIPGRTTIFVSPLELGPPVGWPVQYRVSGREAAQVREIALKLGQTMGETQNLRLVNFDWMEPSREVRVRIDQDQARLLGLSSQTLSDTLNTVMSGTPITQVRDGIYLINVVARAYDEQRVSLSTLRSLQLPLPNGRTVPLSQVAMFDFDQEYPLIRRRDRVPTLTVQADVRADATPEGAVASLKPGIEKLEASCRAATTLRPAGRWKRARNRRPRCSRCCRPLCF